MLLLPFILLAQATFFNDTCRAANGHTPAQNRRHYGLCAAYNEGRLLDRLQLASRSGRVAIVTVTDRGGMGREVVDLRPEAALVLMGKDYKTIGRLHGVTVTVLAHSGKHRRLRLER